MTIYLMHKQHAITGLNYFCKTASKDPEKYLGSGKVWVPHINKYGRNHVVNKSIWAFDDQELATQFALKFSRDNNIVQSKDWANLILEDALDGNIIGSKRSDETKRKQSKSMIGKNTGPLSEERKQKLRKPKSSTMNMSKPLSLEHRANISKARQGMTLSEETKRKLSGPHDKISCPHCNNVGGARAMKRWHFDNCSRK